MKVIAVGDRHEPWSHGRNTRKLISAIEREQPDAVVQVGDLFDMFAATRFARTHNLYTPKREIELGRKKAETFWHAVQEAAPKARCYQIKGNHDDRPYKRMLEKTPELESFFSVRQIFEFPGVETVHDSRDPLVLDGVVYIHGWLTKLGAHMEYFLKPVVCGHTHRGGVVFRNLYGRPIWECNAGYLADKHAIPLRYGPSRVSAMTMGYAQVDDQCPRFVPLPG